LVEIYIFTLQCGFQAIIHLFINEMLKTFNNSRSKPFFLDFCQLVPRKHSSKKESNKIIFGCLILLS